MTRSIARRALLLSLASAVILTACTSPNPVLYSLAPVPGKSEATGPLSVVVYRVSVARYLQRAQIVQSSEGYRLDVFANQDWGEPLEQMITRILIEDITQRLPEATVLNSNGAITAPEDASVEVNIERMDRNASGTLAFSAEAAVHFKKDTRGPELRKVRLSVPVASRATVDEVRAISIAIGQLADTIANMLAAGRG